MIYTLITSFTNTGTRYHYIVIAFVSTFWAVSYVIRIWCFCELCSGAIEANGWIDHKIFRCLISSICLNRCHLANAMKFDCFVELEIGVSLCPPPRRTREKKKMSLMRVNGQYFSAVSACVCFDGMSGCVRECACVCAVWFVHQRLLCLEFSSRRRLSVYLPKDVASVVRLGGGVDGVGGWDRAFINAIFRLIFLRFLLFWLRTMKPKDWGRGWPQYIWSYFFLWPDFGLICAAYTHGNFLCSGTLSTKGSYKF